MNAYLGLGSNLGNRFENLSQSVERLRAVDDIEVREISPVYETDPVGVPEQPRYLNAVLRVETVLEAEKLLGTCLAIESSMGRVRTERWGARNIDIDILLYEDQVVRSGELNLPHLYMHQREFVLRPLADIAPGLVHPVFRVTVRELLAAVGNSGGVRRVDGLNLA